MAGRTTPAYAHALACLSWPSPSARQQEEAEQPGGAPPPPAPYPPDEQVVYGQQPRQLPWRQQRLPRQAHGPLQPFEAGLFVGGVLVHYEDVTAVARKDEPKVELAEHLWIRTQNKSAFCVRYWQIITDE